MIRVRMRPWSSTCSQIWFGGILGVFSRSVGKERYPHGGRLGLAEGNETTLSAMQMFKVPCWATLGNERFGLATIPESVRQLYLFVDNDAGGHLAEERAREAYACEGRLIVTRRPELTGDDWNDVLMRSVRATV